eukprot:1059104_1
MRADEIGMAVALELISLRNSMDQIINIAILSLNLPSIDRDVTSFVHVASCKLNCIRIDILSMSALTPAHVSALVIQSAHHKYATHKTLFPRIVLSISTTALLNNTLLEVYRTLLL